MKQKPPWLKETSPVVGEGLLERWRETSITKNVYLGPGRSQSDCVQKNMAGVRACRRLWGSKLSVNLIWRYDGQLAN